jgi:hypothetical protein
MITKLLNATFFRYPTQQSIVDFSATRSSEFTNPSRFVLNFQYALPELGVRFSGRKVNCVGQLHHQQSACHSFALQLGHDLCLRPIRQLRRMWRSRQHLLHIQVESL